MMTMRLMPENQLASHPGDLEVKDAQIIFNTVWSSLESEYGRQYLRFPKELLWLNGAPGSGKGTHTRFIMRLRDLTAGPIVVSDLLTSPEAQKLKDSGRMVGDTEVTGLVLRELLKPEYTNGTIIDGFPRTKVQVEVLKMLHERLQELRAEFMSTPLKPHFPKPIFHIAVLFVNEKESIARQLKRGDKARAHNDQVRASGEGELMEERVTDFDPDAARNRYRTFKEKTYYALKDLRQIFHFHYIDAHGSVSDVEQRIIRELKYQSSLELGDSTNDRISLLPVASEIIRHARQDLVNRLDDYEENHPELFARVVHLISRKFMPIVVRHAISGMAVINSEDPVFHDGVALQILIDVFTERGFHVTIDLQRLPVPAKVDLQTGEIQCDIRKVFKFRVVFPGCEIRRG